MAFTPGYQDVGLRFLGDIPILRANEDPSVAYYAPCYVKAPLWVAVDNDPITLRLFIHLMSIRSDIPGVKDRTQLNYEGHPYETIVGAATVPHKFKQGKFIEQTLYPGVTNLQPLLYRILQQELVMLYSQPRFIASGEGGPTVNIEVDAKAYAIGSSTPMKINPAEAGYDIEEDLRDRVLGGARLRWGTQAAEPFQLPLSDGSTSKIGDIWLSARFIRRDGLWQETDARNLTSTIAKEGQPFHTDTLWAESDIYSSIATALTAELYAPTPLDSNDILESPIVMLHLNQHRKVGNEEVRGPVRSCVVAASPAELQAPALVPHRMWPQIQFTELKTGAWRHTLNSNLPAWGFCSTREFIAEVQDFIARHTL